jgi:hypothetical protein
MRHWGQADAVVKAAMGLLKSHLPQQFSLNLLNIGATNFSETVQPGSQVAASLTRFLGPQRTDSQPKRGRPSPPGMRLPWHAFT